MEDDIVPESAEPTEALAALTINQGTFTTTEKQIIYTLSEDHRIDAFHVTSSGYLIVGVKVEGIQLVSLHKT